MTRSADGFFWLARSRATRAGLARPLVCVAALATTASATAQPPHSARSAAAQGTTARVKTQEAHGRAASVAVEAAYLSGHQAMVGSHAPATAPVPRDDAGRPMLALATLNRGESLAVPACGDDGGFAASDLDRVAHLLRAASGDEHPIDPRTLSLVYRIETHFMVPEIRVVSGYRVPRPGSRSNHGKGRAMDIVVPGVPDEEVARFARDVGFVGVGVYPASQFVHVDIRPRSYFWVDASGPHTRNRERGILGDVAARSDSAALARGQSPVEPFAVTMDVDAALRARGLGAMTVADDDDDDE
jgi:uncharacterized protein YcbK (DUF882 family)